MNIVLHSNLYKEDINPVLPLLKKLYICAITCGYSFINACLMIISTCIKGMSLNVFQHDILQEPDDQDNSQVG